MISTPILFLIFNRPDATLRVFKEIRKVQPRQLYISADGPRKDHPSDSIKCKEARAIAEQVDWDCKVFTLFRETNVGCKVAISSAIDWFFSNVEVGIVLEDDCVPDQSFFPFCEDLLERYMGDERAMMISGDNFQFGKAATEDSYYFSIYPHIWGWATWKRAWEHYDVDMNAWPYFKSNNKLSGMLNKKAARYWAKIFDKVYNGKIDTWDYQWVFACWANHGLSITPNKNLVSNIGFNNGTHTNGSSVFSSMSTEPMRFPVVHPEQICSNHKLDENTEQLWFSGSESAICRMREMVGWWLK